MQHLHKRYITNFQFEMVHPKVIHPTWCIIRALPCILVVHGCIINLKFSILYIPSVFSVIKIFLFAVHGPRLTNHELYIVFSILIILRQAKRSRPDVSRKLSGSFFSHSLSCYASIILNIRNIRYNDILHF